MFIAYHSFFIFIKNRKRNTVHFSLFIFMKELKNELLTQIKINFSEVKSTRYSKASSCQGDGDFPLYNGHADTKNWLFRKQLMYFNINITGCYFHFCFILIVNCDIKHISRSSHREVLP